jgi:uncharacterized glyoxalase superfamily protein PhnB
MLVNRSMPSCTVIPVLVYDDAAAAAAWLCETFGFTERWGAGDDRVQLAVGDGAVVVSERPDSASGEERRPPSKAHGCHSVIVRVDDVNRHYEHALRRGAPILDPPTDHPSGERQYTAEDPGGHRWSFSESIADVAPEKWCGTSAPGR